VSFEDFRAGVRRLGRAGAVGQLAALAEAAGVVVDGLHGVGDGVDRALVDMARMLGETGVMGRASVAHVLRGAVTAS